MCGIAGWIDWEADLTRAGPVAEALRESLRHRGPDDAGTWLSPRAAIVHRRLTVVDPEGGAQPMVKTLGGRTYVITYNGELYNTADLREQLEAAGHRFRGYSDTEVLLTAFIEWGPACVHRLNGIFAFGIWSEADQSLFLARDRLGVKPLFFAQRGTAFLFASELKALLAHPAVRPEVGAEGLAEVLVMGPGRTPGHGVFRGIHELKPGHWLRLDRGGVHVARYWALQSRPHEDDLHTTARRVRELLQDTVERQLVSDVPVCTLLSGGIDSSAVTAFAAAAFAREGRAPIRTFSTDYAGNDRHFRPTAFQPGADTPWVRRVSAFLRTDHREVVVDTPDLADALVPATRARDLPGMADVDASLLLFSREIKKEATVALSGEAADEIFGGYPWFRMEDALSAPTFPWMRMTRERARFLAPEVREWIRPEEYVDRRYREALDEVPRLPGEGPREARLREIAYLSITRFMPTLLDRKDRMSMAVGLEVRVPYCDHRLVEYVWNIPWDMKMADGMEKGILRRALRGVLPDDVLERRKSPYPKTHDPAYLELVRDRALRLLDDPGSPLRSLFDAEAVRDLARSAQASSNLPWYGQLMSGPQFFAYLIQVDAWMREYRVVIR
ncbi:asparagine synthase (glutamine-hydrolyzing) [Caldinitratiruptor microaerophilus]|uniref:asparagine synthase (glutamine-hydrolyzing) n=1 Tax=Caldinitratiruptor microaerophilus TaxID=671077 RepID=A0AA35CJM0_9FIRM|nr:asparagine synthase (glutamine-hydrolyzing) [Caldinitratiruptor microaerophilus]BDG59563.1 asparagine synthetase B [Caldinitratiruptor microaerophilus]